MLKLILNWNAFCSGLLITAYNFWSTIFVGQDRAMESAQRQALEFFEENQGAVESFTSLMQSPARVTMPETSPELAVQWSVFVQKFGDEPNPLKVPGFLLWVQQSRALIDPAMELVTAGAIAAFAERYPELADDWREDFKLVFANAERVQMLADADRPGWNDFHMARWCVLRDETTVRELVRRASLPGQVGGSCMWMLTSVASQCPALKEALAREGFKVSQVTAPVPSLVDSTGRPFKEYRDDQAAALEDKYAALQGATIRTVMVREDAGVTHVVVDTDCGMRGFSSPILAVSGPGIAPVYAAVDADFVEEVGCSPTR